MKQIFSPAGPARLILAFTVLIVPLLALPASAHMMPLTNRQIAAGSPQVVVAVVEAARPRWNPQHTFIFTDYLLRIEDSLRGEAPERITLAIPGGQIGDEIHGTCLSTPLVTGARYLLFLQDLDRPTLAPITGGWQGAFREAAGPQGKRFAVRGPGEGERVRATSGRVLEFSEVVRAARALIARVETSPGPAGEARLAAGAPLEWAASPALESSGGPTAGKFVVERPAVAPLVVHPMPENVPFSGLDRRAMAYWNLYGRNIFKVSPQPATEWAFGNGLSEIPGFVSNADLVQQFGIGWPPDGVDAVLWQLSPDRRHTVEADIAFNPDREWTLDEDLATRGLNVLAFQEWILRELGTAWGYQGLYSLGQDSPLSDHDSLMSPIAQGYEPPEIFAEDAAAARATYPGAKPVRDGLISSYTLQVSGDSLSLAAATASTDSVPAGGSFALVHPIKIENPGMKPLAQPKVEIYLVPRRYSFDGAVLLKKIAVRATVRSRGVVKFEAGQVRVPAGTPAGTYYFALLLRDPQDAYQANNLAWSSPWAKIEVTR